MANWYSDLGASAAIPQTKLIVQIPNQCFLSETSFLVHFHQGLESNLKYWARNLEKLQYSQHIEDYVSTTELFTKWLTMHPFTILATILNAKISLLNFYFICNESKFFM